VHLCSITYEKRRDELRLILAHAATLPKDAEIAIMGDFNAVSREDEKYHDQRIVDFIKNWQKQDPRVRDLVDGKPDYSAMDLLREAGFRDTFWLKFKEHTGTFPTKKYGDPVPRRIDAIWVNDALARKLVSCTVDRRLDQKLAEARSKSWRAGRRQTGLFRHGPPPRGRFSRYVLVEVQRTHRHLPYEKVRRPRTAAHRCDLGKRCTRQEAGIMHGHQRYGD